MENIFKTTHLDTLHLMFSNYLHQIAFLSQSIWKVISSRVVAIVQLLKQLVKWTTIFSESHSLLCHRNTHQSTCQPAFICFRKTHNENIIIKINSIIMTVNN